MLENDFFLALKSHIFELFKNSLPVEFVYHNFNHTMNVVNACSEIGTAENISEKDMEILIIAAWFHDTGFIKSHKKHEDHGKKIAEAYLN